MSKIKNSEEFQRMMDEQELAASFAYQEQEAEYDALRKDLAHLQALEKARVAYDIASEALEIATDNYADALNNLLTLMEESDDTDRQDVQDNSDRGYQQNQETNQVSRGSSTRTNQYRARRHRI